MGKIVLIADAQAAMRETVATALIPQGHTVIGADSCASALKYSQSQHVELLISDLSMPNMEGLELISKIRALPQYREIPIIMMVAPMHEDRKFVGKRLGGTGWVLKPFTPETLIGIIERVTTGAQTKPGFPSITPRYFTHP